MSLPDRVRRLMEAKGLNPHSTAVGSGLGEDAVRDILRGKAKDPGASKVLALAKLLETSVEALYVEDDAEFEALAPPLSPTREVMLPVRYTCAAGNFREIDETSQVEPRMEPAERFPAYAAWPQWLELVEGDSIDKLIPDGALIHVVDALAMGYAPVDGDIVVAQRSRMNGLMRERTVKQVEISRAGVKLWPRSHNPLHQEALDLTAGAANDQLTEVTIVGKVLQAYIRFGKRD